MSCCAYPSDGDCQDCRKGTWKAAVLCKYGYIYLCGACAEFFLKVKQDKQGKKYDQLMKKVFGRY